MLLELVDPVEVVGTVVEPVVPDVPGVDVEDPDEATVPVTVPSDGLSPARLSC